MFNIKALFISNINHPQDHMGLKAPATSLMDNIIDLHNFIFFFILFISGIVLWLLIQIMDNFILIYNFNFITNNHLYKVVVKYWIYINASLTNRNRAFKEDKLLEAFWTFFPALILILISVPSFFMLYLSEESIETLLTVKAVGFQWYWTYDFSDLFPFWYNLKTSELDLDDYFIESYMEPTDYLNKDEGQFRLLETDNILLLPIKIHLRLIITSMDTLHSFAIPSLGIKVDAIPGRLNKIDLFLYRMGVFYGQCSELCGIGHGFMPICLFAFSHLNFLIGDL